MIPSPSKGGVDMASYVTLAEFKAEMGITSTDWDVRLESILESASRAVDRLVGVQDNAFAAGNTPTARIYPLHDPNPWLVVDYFIALSMVEWAASDDAATWADITSEVMPAHSGTPGPSRVIVRKPKPFTPIVPSPWYPYFSPGFYRITAVWGLSATPPAEIKRAVILLGAQWFRRSQVGYSPTAVEGYGVTLRFEQTIPEDVRAILAPYVSLIQNV